MSDRLVDSRLLRPLFRNWAWHPSTLAPHQRKRAAQVVQCLLDAGAELPRDLIGIAASIGGDMMRLFMDHPGHFQALSQRHKETALLGAVGYERRANVALLLEAGLSANVWPFTESDLAGICPFYCGRLRTYHPPTLLHLAVCTRNLSVVQLLVQRSALLDVLDETGHTPESLARALCGGVDEVVKCLAAARKEAARLLSVAAGRGSHTSATVDALDSHSTTTATSSGDPCSSSFSSSSTTTTITTTTTTSSSGDSSSSSSSTETPSLASTQHISAVSPLLPTSPPPRMALTSSGRRVLVRTRLWGE
jgi:Ankyrin repeat